MENNEKCPICGMSSQKVEGGFIVCNICGHKEPIYNNNSSSSNAIHSSPKTANLDTSHVPALIVYIFLIVNMFIPLMSVVEYLKYFSTLNIIIWILDLFSMAALIVLLVASILRIQGKELPRKPNIIFSILFAVFTGLAFILSIVISDPEVGYVIERIIYVGLDIALVFLASLKFDRWATKK
ncbi:MAG: hypothetical protein E7353_10215 [Clostridiales bacterium]|nr:hypothetical protein [Clostridiales bacterium]